jgi:hypothetical protein
MSPTKKKTKTKKGESTIEVMSTKLDGLVEEAVEIVRKMKK